MKNFFKILVDKIRNRSRKTLLSPCRIDPMPDRVILGYRIVRTCYACPEQYDVFNKLNKLSGYLRLRHGIFTVQYPDVYGKVIFEANPHGDGIFEEYERDHFLSKAILAIKKEEIQEKRYGPA